MFKKHEIFHYVWARTCIWSCFVMKTDLICTFSVKGAFRPRPPSENHNKQTRHSCCQYKHLNQSHDTRHAPKPFNHISMFLHIPNCPADAGVTLKTIVWCNYCKSRALNPRTHSPPAALMFNMSSIYNPSCHKGRGHTKSGQSRLLD